MGRSMFLLCGYAAIRALGPSVPVAGALDDPTLELHDANEATLTTNDDRKINDQTGQSQQTLIEATTIPPHQHLESALVQTLAPGNTRRSSAARTTPSGLA